MLEGMKGARNKQIGYDENFNTKSKIINSLNAKYKQSKNRKQLRT